MSRQSVVAYSDAKLFWNPENPINEGMVAVDRPELRPLSLKGFLDAFRKF